MHAVEAEGWAGHLCRQCLALAGKGEQPPWWPNERQRWQRYLERILLQRTQHPHELPLAVCALVASFLARPWAP
jgi:hypothetical protein